MRRRWEHEDLYWDRVSSRGKLSHVFLHLPGGFGIWVWSRAAFGNVDFGDFPIRKLEQEVDFYVDDVRFKGRELLKCVLHIASIVKTENRTFANCHPECTS